MKISRERKIDLLLGLTIVLEFLFLFYFFKEHITSVTVNASGFFLSSISFGILLILNFMAAR